MASIRPPEATPPPSKSPFARKPANVWWMMLMLVALFWMRDQWVVSTQVQPIPYSEFVSQLKPGQIESISIGSQFIEGKLKSATPDGRTRIGTTRVATDLARELSAYEVRFEGVVENTLLRNLLSWLIPALLLFAIWSFMARRMAAQGGLGGLLSVGKSHAKLHSETDVKVSFDDVAGVDEANEELRESVEFLRNPEAHGRLGARMPKGVLPEGPPGTGKTLLARALAGEAGVPVFSITGSEFVEMFGGLGAARVRDLFEQARAAAPYIVFIDELDTLGRARGIGPLSGGHDEKEQTLNQLLAVLLGGRAAESLVVGEISTGAADDLVKATDIAHDMVARYGMAPEVGQVVYDRQRLRFLSLTEGMALEQGLSDDMARRIDAAMRALVGEAFARAAAVLTERRPLLEQGAAKSLTQETLSESDLLPIPRAARCGTVPA
jgi:cell division protease FtsH